MRNILLNVLVFVALASGALLASPKSRGDDVSVIEDKTEGLEDWGALAGGARMIIKASRVNASNVIAVVRIKNFSDNAVRLIETLPERDYVLNIRMPDGTAAAETSYKRAVKDSEGEVLRRMVKGLEPGQEVSDELCLSKNFCLDQKGVYNYSQPQDTH